MNNVLLVGNGFDLAHGLLTKYEHFLYLMKNWNEFYDAFKQKRKEGKKKEEADNIQLAQDLFGDGLFADLFKEPEKPIDKYLVDAFEMDEQRIEQLGNIIKNNSWANYYCHCEAEIDGWIDFEKEIYPVIELFEFIFNYDYELQYDRDGSTCVTIPLKSFNAKNLKTAELWDKYIDIGPQKVYLKSMYVTNNYGILKKQILKNLREEFDEFIKAFEIYLHEFVYKKDNVQELKQIKEINADYIISFNYTLTENLYGVNEENTHHIHGMLREDLTVGKNNMVVGVSEQQNQNMDFIYFVKYFQRIQKDSGVKYKEFVDRYFSDDIGNKRKEEYCLHIYGHSLDETDEDILRYVIGSVNEKERFVMKPKQVIIYYYDAADYEQKVINLIKLYGRSIVEKNMENKRFKFILTN